MVKIIKQQRVMETDTIQKNGVSPKDPNIRSRGNFFKWIMLALSFGVACGVHAQGEMIVKVNGNEYQRIPVENLRKLTFPNEKLEIETKGGSEQLAFMLPEIMLVFRGLPTYSEPVASVSDLQVYLHADVLYISTEQQELGRIQLFDMRGLQVAAQYSKENNATMNVAGLSAGVYILKVENRVVKFIKR